MHRRRTISGISVLVLLMALVAGFWTPSPAMGATHLRLCGRVDAYVAPTALLAGTLTVGPATLLIAAGTDVSSQVEVGANLCFDLEIDTAGRITDTTVTANTTTSVDICGLVNALAAADADSYGSLRINGVDFVLAAGSKLPVAVRAGANLCLDLTLNAFGQVAGATARANATGTVRICGRVSAFAAASSTSTGTLTIDGRSFVLGLGTRLPASVRTGANLCAALTINGLAQVSGGTAQANITSTVDVCGQVTAFTAATATSDGSLTIDSVPRAIAAGTTLSPQVRAGAFLRLRLTLDVFGRIADDAVLAAGASIAAVCGAGVQASTSPVPSSSASPSAPATDDASPSASPSQGGGGAAGVGASASPSPAGSAQAPGQAGEPGCSTAGVADEAGGSAGDGGPIPDTASLARAGRVIGLMALPLLVLMLLVIGYLAVQNRREYAVRADRGADRGIEEVAP
jgi:hypothetical protein